MRGRLRFPGLSASVSQSRRCSWESRRSAWQCLLIPPPTAHERFLLSRAIREKHHQIIKKWDYKKLSQKQTIRNCNVTNQLNIRNKRSNKLSSQNSTHRNNQKLNIVHKSDIAIVPEQTFLTCVDQGLLTCESRYSQRRCECSQAILHITSKSGQHRCQNNILLST